MSPSHITVFYIFYSHTHLYMGVAIKYIEQRRKTGVETAR